MSTTALAPVSQPYSGPIIRRGQTVRYTDMQGVVTEGRVQRVVLLRGYYDPTVVVERYLAIEGVGTLTPTSNGGIEVIA